MRNHYERHHSEISRIRRYCCGVYSRMRYSTLTSSKKKNDSLCCDFLFRFRFVLFTQITKWRERGDTLEVLLSSLCWHFFGDWRLRWHYLFKLVLFRMPWLAWCADRRESSKLSTTDKKQAKYDELTDGHLPQSRYLAIYCERRCNSWRGKVNARLVLEAVAWHADATHRRRLLRTVGAPVVFARHPQDRFFLVGC